jgi:hypothetical protein
MKTKTKIKKLILKNKIPISLGIVATTLAAIGINKAIKLSKAKLEKQIRKKIENENLQSKYNKFLACDQTVKPFGNKSAFDLIPIKLIDNILVKFKNMQDINNQCLVNINIKKYCCDNRILIFSEILKYNGYTKGIKKEYSEIIFEWFYPTINKVLDFYVFKYDFSDRTLAIFILLALNNKFTINNINDDKYWNYYPIIYYYSNNKIKNFILYKYNQLTIDEIQSKPTGYFFYAATPFVSDYLKLNFCNKLGNLSKNY